MVSTIVCPRLSTLGLTSLSIVAGNDHAKMVNLLLRQRDAVQNLAVNGLASLSIAARGPVEGIILLLAQEDVNPN